MSEAPPRTSVLSGGHSFLECPRWHDGHLYASDFFKHEVIRWGDDGVPERVVEIPHQPSGLGWTPEGDLLIVSMVDRRLLKWNGVELTEVADLSNHAPWHCNDMVVDDQGRAYVGNFGWDEQTDPNIVSTNLHRVDPDGSIHVAAEGLVCPNGVVITSDGETLLIAESFAARITAFDRADDGTLSNRRVWASFSDRVFTTLDEALTSGALLPDGIALDANGDIWVADCAGRGASLVREGGEILDYVSSGKRATFSVALGGADLKTLYMCTTIPYPYDEGDPSVVHVGEMLQAEVSAPAA